MQTICKYPKYKDSGIEWIGEIPIHWQNIRTKYLAKENVQYGLNISSDNYVDDGIRFVRTTDIDDFGNIQDEGVYLSEADVEPCYLLIEGDFLISRSGTIGRAYVHNKQGEYSYAGYLVRFTFNSTATSQFVFYITKSEAFLRWVSSISIESTIGNVNGQKYANFQFAYPPDAEVKPIVNYLDEKTALIDELIGKKRRQVELLKEQRQTVINQAVTKGLDPDVEMKDSGIEWLGKIPKHWEVKKLKHILSDVVDNRGRTPPFGETGIPMLEVKQLDSQSIHPVCEFEKFVSEDDVKKYVRKHLQKDDVLIATVGATAGKTAIVPNTPNYFIAQNIVAFRAYSYCEPKFLFYILRSDYFQESLKIINKTNTIDNLKVSIFINNYCVLPCIDEQAEIVDFIENEIASIDKSISQSKRQIQLLQEYRTALISEAVTGKIDVRLVG